MATTAPTPERTKIEPIPAGTHVAIMYKILQIGTVPEEYKGEKKNMAKIYLTFELPNETRVFKPEEGPKPRVISKEFTFSMGPKANLRKFVEGIIGVNLHDDEAYAFDIETLLGKPFLMSIVHKKSSKGDTYAKIMGAQPMMKGMEVPKQVNATEIMNYANFDEVRFDKLPDFLKEKMKTSAEYQMLMMKRGKAQSEVDNFDVNTIKYPDEVDADSIPF